MPYTNTKVKEDRLDIHGKSSFFVYYVNTQTLTDNVLSEADLKISYTSIPGITGFDYTVDSIAALDNSNLINYDNNKPGAVYTIDNVNVFFNWVGDIPYTELKLLGNSGYYNGPYATGKWYKYKMNYNMGETAENSFSYSVLDADGKDPNYYTDTNNALTGNVLHIPMFLDNIMVGSFQTRTGFFNDGTSKNELRAQLKAVIDAQFTGRQLAEKIASVDKYVGKVLYNSGDKKVYTVDKTTS